MAFLTVNFMAKSLLRTVPVNVVIPSDKLLFPGMPVPEKKPFKTLYLLHGILGNYTDWVNGTRLQALANNKNLCVVMPSGDNKFYANSSKTGDRYGDFIANDLVEFIEDTFNVSKDPADRFIGGLSMGGFGAITNALRNPEKYSHVVMLSAALIKNQILNSTNEPGHDFLTKQQYETIFDLNDAKDYENSVNNYEKLAKDLAGSSNKPKIYMACGTEDGLMAPNREYLKLLQDNGFDVTWQEGPGGHDWTFWDAYIEKAMEWLPLAESVRGISSENVGIK